LLVCVARSQLRTETVSFSVEQELGKEVVFRPNAAFDKPEIYEALEERGVKYAIRLPSNDRLLRDTEELLTRPVAWSSHKPIVWYKGFLDQAAS